MSNIKLNTESGSITLIPESGQGNVDVTVPRAGVGKVLQVASTTKTDSWQSTASGWIDVTGLSISITTTGGDIYGNFSLHLDASSSNAKAYFRILRNGSVVGNATGDDGITGAWNTFGTGSDAQQFTPTFLDTGLTAGTYTYTVQVDKSGCSSISCNRFSSHTTIIAQSTMTLSEIAN